MTLAQTGSSSTQSTWICSRWQYDDIVTARKYWSYYSFRKKKKSKCMYWFWYIWLTYNLCGSYRPLHIQSGRSALKNVYEMIVYLHVCIMFLTYACGDCKSLNPSWEVCVQLLLLSTVFSMYKAAECTLYIHFGWVSPSMVSLHLGTFLEPYGDFLNGTFKHSVIV